LRFDQLAKLGPSAALGQRGRQLLARRLRRFRATSQVQEVGGHLETMLTQVVRPAAAQRFNSLAHLQRVAHRLP
jgi:hypothetical protein